MTSPKLPPEVRWALWALRAGLAVALVGIVGFLLSFGQVGAPSLASADYHPMPTVALASVVAWFVGVGVATGARLHVRGVARRHASRREGLTGEDEN